MKYSEKVLAFIGKWLNDVQTKPGGYAIAYDYKHDPQKLTFYRAYKSYNETMAESVFAPSWEAYLDDDVLEKEVTDALNKLKEKVDRWHACKKVDRAKDFLKEDGYERSRMMKIRVTDAIDFGEIVWNWAEIHPEMKKYFRIMHEYVPDLQAFRLTMERAYPDEAKYGIVRLLPEDILGNMVCPSDYINATLEEMYKKLTEDSDLEKKLRNYVKSWTIVCIDRREHITFGVRPEGSDGYMVSFEKDIENDFAVNTVIVKRYIPKKKVENWDADEGYVAEALSDLYQILKEKEKKEMGNNCVKADNDQMLKMAKAAVVAWYNEHNAPTTISLEDVYIVWFCKTLQNWKALAGTHHGDGMYYEITFDGDKDCAYVDAYKKWQNVQMDGSKLREAI